MSDQKNSTKKTSPAGKKSAGKSPVRKKSAGKKSDAHSFPPSIAGQFDMTGQLGATGQPSATGQLGALGAMGAVGRPDTVGRPDAVSRPGDRSGGRPGSSIGQPGAAGYPGYWLGSPLNARGAAPHPWRAPWAPRPWAPNWPGWSNSSGMPGWSHIPHSPNMRGVMGMPGSSGFAGVYGANADAANAGMRMGARGNANLGIGSSAIPGVDLAADLDADPDSDSDDDSLDSYRPDPAIKLPSKLQSVVVEIAVVGLVLSVLALAASFVPNLGAFAIIVGIAGLAFGITSLIGTFQDATRLRWMSIATVVAAVAAIIVAIVVQALVPASLPVDESSAASSAEVVQSSSASNADDNEMKLATSAGDTARSFASSAASSAGSSASDSADADLSGDDAATEDSSIWGYNTTEDPGVLVETASGDKNGWVSAADATDVPIETTVEYADGLAVCVDAVTPDLINFDGTIISCASVTYTNISGDPHSYYEYDWHAVNADGMELSPCYYSGNICELGSGKIQPGTTVSGNVYFEGSLSAVLFSNSQIADGVSWLL